MGLGLRVDLRIPQIGTFFRPFAGETDDCGKTGYALGSRGPATMKSTAISSDRKVTIMR
jgi:hypothetical protein